MRYFKSCLGIFLFVIVVYALASCSNEEENPFVLVQNSNITLEVLSEQVLEFETNDDLGVNFESNDETIVTVNESGVIQAVGIGIATVTITSKTDGDVKVNINITVVEKIPTELVISGEDTLIFGNTTQLVIETTPENACDEVLWSTSDESVATVNENGMVTPISLGEVVITATSTLDDTIVGTHQMTIIEPVPAEIKINGSNTVLLTSTLSLSASVDPALANQEVIWSSSDESVATIDSSGMITPVSKGIVTIKAESSVDANVYETIDINVVNYFFVDKDVVSGDSKDFLGLTFTFGINLFNNIQEAINQGTDVDIFVNSGRYDELITINKNDIHLFGANYDINPNSGIRVNETTLTGVITIGDEANYYENIMINGFNFTETAQIISSEKAIHGLEFSNNLVENITYISSDIIGFIQIVGTDASNGVHNLLVENNKFSNIYSTEPGAKVVRPIWINYALDLTIRNNVFTNYDRDIYLENTDGITLVEKNTFEYNTYRALHIVSFLGGQILVYENYFNNSNDWSVAIWGKAEYDEGVLIDVSYNTLDTIYKGIMIDPEYLNSEGAWVADKLIFAYANYNIVKNATVYNGYSSDSYSVDFTKNYWGEATPSDSKFGNLTIEYYGDYYTIEEDVPTRDEVSNTYPNGIIITNPVVNLNSGDFYQLNIQVSPFDANKDKLYWSSSDDTVVSVSQNGLVSALKSGTADITIQSVIDPSINYSITIVVDTDAGIEILFSNSDNNLIVGDTLNLTAKPFPDSEKDKNVIWESSDDTIATVDQNGVVTTLSEGVVTITARLEDNLSVRSDVILNIYSQLDENNLLDLITMYQTLSSDIYYFTAYGSFNYTYGTHRSVSPYLFEENLIQQDFIGISQYTRTGRLMSEIPAGVTSYNDDNIQWIVVHDTANTNSSATAAMHALYLHNMTNNSSNTTYVSWHYTVDENEIYQHIPDNERAYHAGDGSKLVGEGTFLGGGNTNGIGIEMAVNQGSDIYKTWHKTAKLVAQLLIKYNLPLDNFKFHNDYSGKDCPRTLRNALLQDNFKKMVEIEYKIRMNHQNAQINMKSNYPEYLDDNGRIIKMPLLPMTVSYEVTVTENNVTETRTFYIYLPGTLS